ncbi:MAG: GNAT family N-acetyltransferase [Methylocystis sp.]|jgi:ribosomal protein S18 acetylase RimI-like enzyme|nr:GNAT family N-acetyltransferase [Methylocystis sp.]MCA3583472.1 GNAT family N-acetyltransferase [Methylocystis sp.]MCA3587434.1 GNAT family N-acetyltransferase [Methylocystis sp.]MCA3592767.1 GNAT family N-acetyltransferase [Methylocystis sp.]
MSTRTIRIRVAEPADAAGVADVHDAAWMEAYRGIIPGAHLERMVQRRGRKWWANALSRGSRIAVLDFDDTIAGYASYGRNRAVSLPYRGEIFELYLKPAYQGLGFGHRLFSAAQKELANLGLNSVLVWSLADNERAIAFYERLGGILVGRAHETFGDVSRERLAFGWR